MTPSLILIGSCGVCFDESVIALRADGRVIFHCVLCGNTYREVPHAPDVKEINALADAAPAGFSFPTEAELADLDVPVRTLSREDSARFYAWLVGNARPRRKDHGPVAELSDEDSARFHEWLVEKARPRRKDH